MTCAWLGLWRVHRLCVSQPIRAVHVGQRAIIGPGASLWYYFAGIVFWAYRPFSFMQPLQEVQFAAARESEIQSTKFLFPPTQPIASYDRHKLKLSTDFICSTSNDVKYRKVRKLKWTGTMWWLTRKGIYTWFWENVELTSMSLCSLNWDQHLLGE